MIPEFRIIDKEDYQEKLTIKVPKSWWFTSSTYPLLNDNSAERKTLKVISFKDIKRKTPPKPSYWDITQGDYMVREDSNRIYKSLEAKKKFFLISIYLFLLFGTTILFLLS